MASRVEVILKAIVDGSSSSEIPPAQSRNEALLIQILNKVNELDEKAGKLPIHICGSSEYDAETGMPTVQNPNEDTFYLVPSGEGNNLYDEWVWTNQSWEMFGSAGVEITVDDHLDGESVNPVQNKVVEAGLSGKLDTNQGAANAGKAMVVGVNGNVAPGPAGFVVPSNAGAHNSIYRGEYLGDAVTAAQYDAIDAGTFDDLFIGDYWTINGVNWWIASFDYWYGAGDTVCVTHHLVIVPDSAIATCAMNKTDTTSGAYIGSDYYTGNNGNTGKATAKSAIEAAFGNSHILVHRVLLQNAVTDGYESYGTWYDSTFELLTERMVYGCDIFHNYIHGVNRASFYSVDTTQLSIYRYNRVYISNNVRGWLRDVASNTEFSALSDNNNVSIAVSSNSRGVRPAFGICKANQV